MRISRFNTKRREGTNSSKPVVSIENLEWTEKLDPVLPFMYYYQAPPAIKFIVETAFIIDHRNGKYEANLKNHPKNLLIT